MVDLMICRLKNLLFFDILLLYCDTNLNSSIICCIFSCNMYLFLVLLFHYQHYHFARVIKIFLMHLLFYQRLCYQLNQQLLLLFFKLIFLKQFLLHPLQIFQRYREVFDHIYCLNFYLCFQQKTKIHILLHILQVQLNRFNRISLDSIEYFIFVHQQIFHLVTKVKFILSSISNG